MPRALTDREMLVLSHVVMDPTAWWAHACAYTADGSRALDAEGALANKVARWGPEYDTALAAGDYKNRVVRQAEEDALVRGR